MKSFSIIIAFAMIFTVICSGCTSPQPLSVIPNPMVEKLPGEVVNSTLVYGIMGCNQIDLPKTSGTYRVKIETMTPNGQVVVGYGYQTNEPFHTRFGDQKNLVDHREILGVTDDYNVIDRVIMIPENVIDPRLYFEIRSFSKMASPIKISISKVEDPWGMK